MPDDVNEMLTRLLHEVVDVRRSFEQRIDGVENEIRSFRSEVLANFDEVYRRLDRLESEYQSLAAAVARLERRAEDDEADRKRIRQEIESLKARVAELEHRLDELDSESQDSHDA